jgi:hypothetical protein
MFGNDKDPEGKEWREGIYLTTAKNSLEADILESKLRGEGIPSIRRYRGASNAMEIIMGTNTAFPIELYVPEEALEDAKNIIIAIPLVGDEIPEE